MGNITMHIDMDAFFAAIEERAKPRLRGKPIVIGADPKDGRGRGVVSTANYLARTYGIHSAQPISLAWNLAETAHKRGKPATTFISPRTKKYSEAAKKIMALIEPLVDKLEIASIDEAYADISSLKTYTSALKRAKEIRQVVKTREKITCSIGIGENKLIAKIASGHNKPDGLTLVTPAQVQNFLDPMPVGIIPGVGKKAQEKLNRKRILSIRDLRKVSREELIKLFGKFGGSLYEKSRGMGNYVTGEERVRKSIGHEHTFENDIKDSKILIPTLIDLVQSVFSEAKMKKFSYRTVSIKVRLDDFSTYNRSHTPPNGPPKSKRALQNEALALFLPFLDRRENPKRKKIRLIGVRVES